MKKSTRIALGLGTALLFLPLVSSAITASSVSSLLQTSLASALDGVFADLQTYVFRWLGFFILVQMIWTNFGLLISGADTEKFLAKFFAGVFWAGICLFIMNNGPDFIKSIASFFLDHATGGAHVTFDPSYPISLGVNNASRMLEAMDGANGGILASFNPFPSIMMGLVSLAILATCTVIAFKILMIFIETKIVIALSPLSFALLGLNAVREQGFAPFRYLISMAYRMLIFGAILSAMASLSNAIVEAFNALPASSDPSFWPPIWTAAIGYSLLGALALRADSIAAMLSSGTSQMSTGDAAAVAAVTGAAAGGGLGAIAGALSGASTAASPIKSMGEFIKELGSGGSVKDASVKGSGGGHAGDAPTRPAASLAEKAANASSPPSRPAESPGSSQSPAPTRADATTGNPLPEVNSRWAPPSEPTPSGGNASAAGIGGSNEADMNKKLDQLLQGSGPREKSVGDHLGELSRRAENTPVQVSMNTNSEHF